MSGRLQQDASNAVKVTAALPNAANTVNTSSIDISANAPYPIVEKFTVRVGVGLGTGANSKNINTVLQHTGANALGVDTANWANIPTLAPLVAPLNTTNVIPVNFNVSLPPDVKEFIRAQATGEANGGNSSDGTLTLQLLF